jgi:hypothetical protein
MWPRAANTSGGCGEQGAAVDGRASALVVERKRRHGYGRHGTRGEQVVYASAEAGAAGERGKVSREEGAVRKSRSQSLKKEE